MQALLGKKKLVLIFLTTFFIAVILLFAEANIINGNNSFKLTKNEYGISDSIEGYINISLASQSAESNIRMVINNQEQNISLLDFLSYSGLKSGKDFLCNPKTCIRSYQTVGSSSKSKKLKSGSTIIGGIIIGGNIELKTDVLEFDVHGGNSIPACGISPLIIDFLSDKDIDWQYLEGGDFCGALVPSICYDDSNATKNFDVTSTGYCQKVFLPISSRFQLSTLVKKNKGGGDLVLFLYDEKTGNSETCNIEEPNVTSYIQKNCTVNFPVVSYGKDQEYYICIRDELSDNAYSVKGETIEPLCGTVGLPDSNSNGNADFALLVQPASIQSFNKTITFNDTEFMKTHGEGLSKYIRDYISEQYDSNCISGCIVPIEIKSEQEVTVDNFAISYCTEGLCTTENDFFELATKPASIDMNTTKISLEAANFTAVGSGNQTVTLFIDNFSIGSEQISIEKIPIIKGIDQIGNEAMETIQFVVNAYSPKNNSIFSYKWDFGDESTETTLSNITTHIYNNVGKFKVKIEVTDSQGLKGTKSKEINIGSPKEILNKTISAKKELVRNMTSEIEAMGWYSDFLLKEIGSADMSDRLSEYERQYILATTDAEYLDIMTKLNELKVPIRVYESETVEDLPLAIDIDSIMPEYVEKLNGGTYDTEYAAETRNAIWNWNSKSLDTTLSSNVISIANEDNSTEDIATIINMRITPKVEDLPETFFVVLLPYEKAKFASEYGQQQLDGAIGFDFKEMKEQNINLAAEGRINAENLVTFGSANLADINIQIPQEVKCNNDGKCEKGENWANCRNDCKPIGRAIFYFILVIVLIYFAYLSLYKWYKTKYESYLFKNRQDLYNLLFFTGNSLKKGKEEKEVVEELKRAGWNSEQIDYAIRKVTGKPIGLPEIRIKIKGIKLARIAKKMS